MPDVPLSPGKHRKHCHHMQTKCKHSKSLPPYAKKAKRKTPLTLNKLHIMCLRTTSSPAIDGDQYKYLFKPMERMSVINDQHNTCLRKSTPHLKTVQHFTHLPPGHKACDKQMLPWAQQRTRYKLYKTLIRGLLQIRNAANCGHHHNRTYSPMSYKQGTVRPGEGLARDANNCRMPSLIGIPISQRKGNVH